MGNFAMFERNEATIIPFDLLYKTTLKHQKSTKF